MLRLKAIALEKASMRSGICTTIMISTGVHLRVAQSSNAAPLQRFGDGPSTCPSLKSRTGAPMCLSSLTTVRDDPCRRCKSNCRMTCNNGTAPCRVFGAEPLRFCADMKVLSGYESITHTVYRLSSPGVGWANARPFAHGIHLHGPLLA